MSDRTVRDPIRLSDPIAPDALLDDNVLRVLVVIYDLADGMAHRDVTVAAIRRRCGELRVFQMTNEEFDEYKAQVRDRVAKLRN